MLSIILDRMIFDYENIAYYDLKDGQLLAKKMSETEQSVFHDLYEVELEKSTLIVKEITNQSWNEETKKSQVFFIEQKNRDKKGITLTKKDFGKLLAIFSEISEK